MANRSDRDPPSLYDLLDFESFGEMRRGSADSIRASRYLPALQAGYKPEAYLSQHTNSSLQTGGVHIKVMIDKSGSNKAAMDEINQDRDVPILIRQNKYLNNVIEQDHRAA